MRLSFKNESGFNLLKSSEFSSTESLVSCGNSSTLISTAGATVRITLVGEEEQGFVDFARIDDTDDEEDDDEHEQEEEEEEEDDDDEEQEAEEQADGEDNASRCRAVDVFRRRYV